MIQNDTYMLEATREELALTLRCRVAELNETMPNLKASGIGDVTLHSNGLVTLISRRLQREFLARENGRLRVQKHRKKPPCNTKPPSGSGSASESPPKEGSGEGRPPPKAPEPPPVKAPKRQLTDAWCEAYERHHGAKYLFQGVKDGIAADKLLRLGIPVEKVIELAVEAWKRPDGFNCKHASELSRFAACFNAIRAEITAAKRAEQPGGSTNRIPPHRGGNL